MIRRLIACLMVLAVGPLARAQDADRSKVETQAAGQAAEADRLFKQGEWEPAIALYEAERASRAALGDVRYEAYALRAIGCCRAELGDDEGAIASLAKAEAIDLKREDKGYAGYDLLLIGRAELRLDRPASAIKTLEKAIPRLATAIDRDHETDAHLVLTRIFLNLGRPDEARPHVARAMVLADELKDQWRIADSWASSGQVEGALGNLGLALERFADAEELYEQEGRGGEAAWIETMTGSALALMGRADLALARFEEAARRHEHLEDAGSLAENLSAIAGLQLESNQIDLALASATKAVEKSQEVDDRSREIEARVRLSQVQGRQGHWKDASETLDEALILVRQVARDQPADQIRLILTAASTDHRARLDDKALERLELARKIAENSQEADLKALVAEARREFDDRDKARSLPNHRADSKTSRAMV